MLSFPPSKINIGLNITGKRADGFHDLETVFYPVNIKDALEIIEAPGAAATSFTTSGNAVDGNEEDNLCLKAYRLLKNDFPQIPALKIHLHKNIPMGAGLGGGSSDAASMLLLLNNMFHLGIDEPGFMKYALQLGSDCPFFIRNKPSFASGRGEQLSDVSLDLTGYRIMIVHPGIHINTGKAFSQLDPADFSKPGALHEALKAGIHAWKDTVKNDFEKPVFSQHPEIAAIKAGFYENGALYSAMSGSGSSVFGIFKKEDEVNIKFPHHYFCQTV